MIALAVHQREVLGVGGEPGLPGDETLEGVDIIAVAVELADIVEPHPVAPVGVEGEIAVDDADVVRGVHGLEEAAEGEVIRGGKSSAVGLKRRQPKYFSRRCTTP